MFIQRALKKTEYLVTKIIFNEFSRNIIMT